MIPRPINPDSGFPQNIDPATGLEWGVDPTTDERTAAFTAAFLNAKDDSDAEERLWMVAVDVGGGNEVEVCCRDPLTVEKQDEWMTTAEGQIDEGGDPIATRPVNPITNTGYGINPVT